MIEEVGSAYVFLSILALIVIEISSVLRKIDLEDEVEVPGLLPPVFPKMFRECSLFGRFGFLHWVSHLILVLGYFIFTGMGMFGLSLIFLFSTIILGIVWAIYPLLEATNIYGKMLKKKINPHSCLIHVWIVIINMCLIMFCSALLMKPDGWLLNLLMGVLLLVILFSPAFYLKALYKEIIELKESRWLVEN
ncbi:MAG: hypothetical protein KJ886_01730 [Candidatus Thermoplasmatota archaeon]|nr:hypothetical protein [Candidatus Thermoplasmatota archaeon]MBU4189704.1 hypothetical protein [Candidatus Thermoplasmatota archaeon]MCG2825051.1 hypothetical protein [Thermoplasmatales archaeon]